ncbi:DUF6907 domain-containing protein [Microbispora bryophytorum]|uniref:DUF6907 domain-containing protein n=1 Tax=Microbispora bryophytorum TaxID=1460882 RepID=UPI0033E821B2
MTHIGLKPAPDTKYDFETGFTATCPAWCERDMRIDGEHSHLSASAILPVVDVPQDSDPELWPHLAVELVQHTGEEPRVVVLRSHMCERDEGEFFTLDQAEALHQALGEAITRLREAGR